MSSRTMAIGLAGVAWIVAVASWFTLESSTASSYFPRYSWAANMISELGVPYMYTGGVHWMDYSPMSWLMNLNFFGTACLYSFPQWLLLFATQGEGQLDRRMRTGRAVLSAFFLVGLILVGLVHGGPREHQDGSIIEHEIGAGFAILGGNLCSIFAGASPSQIKPVTTSSAYRIGCIVLGASGIIFLVALLTITPQSQAGTVERLSVYTILAWELFTGFYLLTAPIKGSAKVKIR